MTAPPGSAAAQAARLADAYQCTRATTRALAVGLDPELAALQSMPTGQPSEVAPRAHVVVFRAVRLARRGRCRPRAVRSSLRDALQFLLRAGRRGLAARAARTAGAPEPRHGAALPRLDRRTGAADNSATASSRLRSRSASSWGCITSSSTRNCCSPTSSTSCPCNPMHPHTVHAWSRCAFPAGCR